MNPSQRREQGDATEIDGFRLAIWQETKSRITSQAPLLSSFLARGLIASKIKMRKPIRGLYEGIPVPIPAASLPLHLGMGDRMSVKRAKKMTSMPFFSFGEKKQIRNVLA